MPSITSRVCPAKHARPDWLLAAFAFVTVIKNPPAPSAGTPCWETAVGALIAGVTHDRLRLRPVEITSTVQKDAETTWTITLKALRDRFVV